MASYGPHPGRTRFKDWYICTGGEDAPPLWYRSYTSKAGVQTYTIWNLRGSERYYSARYGTDLYKALRAHPRYPGQPQAQGTTREKLYQKGVDKRHRR